MSIPGKGAPLLVAGSFGLLLLGAGAGAGLYAALAPGSTTTVESAVAPSGQAVQSPAGSGLSINALYQRDYQGVVEIRANSQAGGASGFGFGGGTQTAEGSGFVYDARGDILTNDHVVLGASSISVMLWDGRSFPAALLGADETTDLAVLRISAPAALLHPLALADSAAVSVGDPVIAIGSPFGLPETVTSGIVSALGRSINSPNNFTIGGVIQTDAAINHGNSGGPLIDASGKVIGITAQIQSDSGGNEGVGFAIPSNTVGSIAAQLVARGAVAHAYLGVEVQDSSSPPGAVLVAILPGTPAAKAGLRKGDILTALDGEAISDESDLAAVLATRKPGQRLRVTFLRAGKSSSVTLTLAARSS